MESIWDIDIASNLFKGLENALTGINALEGATKKVDTALTIAYEKAYLNTLKIIFNR